MQELEKELRAVSEEKRQLQAILQVRTLAIIDYNLSQHLRSVNFRGVLDCMCFYAYSGRRDGGKCASAIGVQVLRFYIAGDPTTHST